ncbi:hypothetical protein C1645_423556 [Glomus cerebriforme]|uniref:Myb-like domain-containing protein n=1 Tax=Glomus cerebriforme TaxID=658196 RepID=A0A397SD80_9GLOM|nr:hypothetical protein C1645_423556 [Glomus cerebriforme]
MKEWEKQGKISKSPFANLAKKLKSNGYNFDSKAICDYWWNVLDPRLNHGPFSQEEKDYIYEKARKYQETNDKIPWKFLQDKFKMKFGKFRSRNDLKNIWNIKKRQLKYGDESGYVDELEYNDNRIEYEIEHKEKYSIQLLL